MQITEKIKCERLPLFILKVKELYEQSTGLSFNDLWILKECADDGKVITRALSSIRMSSTISADDKYVDFDRDMENLTFTDLELIDSCLKYSLRYEFLLVHYNEQAVWGNKAFEKVDGWDVYHGIFQECRSSVINLLTMEYASLPYAKFRNIGESEEYSEENVIKTVICNMGR